MNQTILVAIMALVFAAIAVLGATNPRRLSELTRMIRRQLMRPWSAALRNAWHAFRLGLYTGRGLVGGALDTPANREKFAELGGLGFRVDRTSAVLAQTTDASLFTITGGRVLVTMIIGEVTVAIQNQANATLLKLNPTATGADQDLCASLDIDDDAVGTQYTISGTVANAMRDDLLIGAGGLKSAPLILSEGIIEEECAASNTGEIQWSIWYLPLDRGAVIEAA